MPYTAADGKRVHVNTESEFVSQFETIFSPRIVAALLCQDLETLDYSPTFGTTVGEDEVGLDILFDKEGHSRVRILYVNNSPWPTGRPRKQDDACFHAQIQRSPRK